LDDSDVLALRPGQPLIRASRAADMVLAEPKTAELAEPVQSGPPPLPPQYLATRRSGIDNAAGVAAPATFTSPTLSAWSVEQPEDFWARYERAQNDIALLNPATAMMRAVVGSFEDVRPVVERMIAGSSPGQPAPSVVALTSRPHRARNDWTVLSDQDELVAAARGYDGSATIFAVDVPYGLEPWLAPTVLGLRKAGVELVHYLLPGSSTDEDLATWHGEIGRPAALELTTEVEPGRAIELVDRGEPLVSIAGTPITAALLVALRSEVC